MGAPQEACEYDDRTSPFNLFTLIAHEGFYNTLSASKQRGAIWRIVGYGDFTFVTGMVLIRCPKPTNCVHANRSNDRL